MAKSGQSGIAAILVLPFLAGLASEGAAQSGKSDRAAPAGPSSIQETYEDWRVVCVRRDQGRTCAMTQQILRKQDGRRIASLEISSAGDGSGTVGTFILPFGLALEDGVSVGIDERTIEDGARFVTCLPVGCVTRLSFAADHLERLGAGNALKVTARTSDTREAVTFTLSLKGFTAAFSRLRELRG